MFIVSISHARKQLPEVKEGILKALWDLEGRVLAFENPAWCGSPTAEEGVGSRAGDGDSPWLPALWPGHA